MGKKRKSEASSLDEVDRTMYEIFCRSAISLSQLYTQAMNHQKLSFQAGERHGLEKLYQWILQEQESGIKVGLVDILNYLQTELNYQPPLSSPLPNTGSSVSSGSSSALSDPIRPRLDQNYHVAGGSYFHSNINIVQPNNGHMNSESVGFQDQQQYRDSDYSVDGDSFMDMHAD